MHRNGIASLVCMCVLPAAAQTFTGGGGPIPDDGTWYDFQIPVSGLVPGTIDTIAFGVESVCIDLEHTWIADLDIHLLAPDGTSALLVGGNGGDTDFYTNTCFNADAATPIVDGATPYTGVFRPMTQMGVVNNGQDGNGTWTLRILDTYPFADAGDLFTWSITFGPDPAGYIGLASSNLPIVMINTGGLAIPPDPKVPAEMGIIDNGPGMLNHPTDPFTDYDGRIGIELRGNSSMMFPKKSYGLELWDANDNDTSVALLGMPAESDWVLKASYSDKSLLNDPLAMHVFQRMGHYAPRWRHVELMLNGQYLGVYQWLEKIKRDADRVNIAKLLPTEITGDDLTGGYILRVDWDQGTGGWTSPHPPYNAPGAETIDFQYEYPSDPVLQQQIYIQGTVTSFENALAGPLFADPVWGYRPFIDLRSWIDYLLLNELSRNVDGYRLSTFLHKDKNSNGGALRMGPPWDYDLAWRNANYCDAESVNGWMYLFNYDCPGGKMVPFWWERMMQDTAFTDSLRCRWDELRDGWLSTDSLHAWCDAMADTLADAQQRNFQIWPILGSYVWPNPSPIPSSYQGEITELKNWISLRALWMDLNLPELASGCLNVGTPQTNAGAAPVVFPNPFDDRLSVMLDEPGRWRLELIDALGRMVHQDLLAVATGGARRFDVRVPSSIPPGSYALHLHRDDRSFTVPVIRQ